MDIFWTVLILFVFFEIIFSFALIHLGKWAVVVLGALLVAGVVTALVNAYRRLTERLDRIEEKLDRLAPAAPEQPQEDAQSKQ